jgi:hypothetical protein
MTKLTFSNASNAVRGFRQHFAAIADRMSNDMVRCDFLDPNQDGSFSINLEAVADYQQDRLGVVKYNRIVGVPMLRRSVSRGVVGQAHKLFAQLPAGTARKDAIAAAVAQGIAFYTARTQYQAFHRVGA